MRVVRDDRTPGSPDRGSVRRGLPRGGRPRHPPGAVGVGPGRTPMVREAGRTQAGGTAAHRSERNTMNDIRTAFARQGLIRPWDGRIVGGVCSGVGRRFGLTPWVSRLLFLLLLMVVPGSQLLVYPVLWILMPAEETLVRSRVGSAPPRRLTAPGRPSTTRGRRHEGYGGAWTRETSRPPRTLRERPGRGRHLRPGPARAARRAQGEPLDVVRLPAGARGSAAARRPASTRWTGSTRRAPTSPTRCSAPAAGVLPARSSTSTETVGGDGLRIDRRDEAALLDDAVLPAPTRTSRCSTRSWRSTSTASRTRPPTRSSTRPGDRRSAR